MFRSSRAARASAVASARSWWLGPPTEWMYRLEGRPILKDDWATRPVNPLSGEDRRILPHRLLQTLMYRDAPLSGG